MKTIAIWILNDGFPRLPFCEWVRACWPSKSFPWTGCGRGFPPHKREGVVFSSFITRHLTRFPDLINFPKCDTRWPAGMGFSTHSQFPSVKTKPLPRRTVSNGDAFLSSLFGRVWHTHTRGHTFWAEHLIISVNPLGERGQCLDLIYVSSWLNEGQSGEVEKRKCFLELYDWLSID